MCARVVSRSCWREQAAAIDGHFTPTDTRDMNPMVYLIPLSAAIFALKIYLSFGRGRSRSFYRRYPGRRAEEIARLSGVGIALTVLAVQVGTSGTADFPLFILPLILGSAVSGLLGWRAGRAGEPSWSAWKSSLPARPDG